MDIKFENKLKLGNGIYTTRDIAQVLQIPYAKASLWLNKYWEGELGQYHSQKYSWNIDRTRAIGFHTLVEMYIMGQLIEAGVKPRQVITAHKKLSESYGTDFPFAKKEVIKGIKTDGQKVYFKTNSGAFLTLDGSEQFNFHFIELFFKKLEFDSDKMASRIWPLGKKHKIVCDPHHKFGQPTIEGTNIQAEIIYKMHQAKEPVRYIATLYEISMAQVKDAILFYKDAA